MSWSDTEKNQLRRENARLRAELEAAKKVADAAVASEIAWNAKERVNKMRLEMESIPFSFDFAIYLLRIAEASARAALRSAIPEYRAFTESLSPGKRAVIDAALEKVGEKYD